MIVSSNGQNIPCPACRTPIPFDTRQLLEGVRFSCPQCSVAVALASESQRVVEQAMNRFDELRAGGAGLKNGNNPVRRVG